MTDLKWLKVLIDSLKNNPLQLFIIVVCFIAGFQYTEIEQDRATTILTQQNEITRLNRKVDSLGQVVQLCENVQKESLNKQIEFYKQVNSEIHNTIKSLKE